MEHNKKDANTYIDNTVAYFLFNRQSLLSERDKRLTEKHNRTDESLTFGGIILTLMVLVITTISLVLQSNTLAFVSMSKTQEQLQSVANNSTFNIDSAINFANFSSEAADLNKAVANVFNWIIIAISLFLIANILIQIVYVWLYQVDALNKELDRVERIIKYLHILKIRLNMFKGREADIEKLVNTPVEDPHFLSVLEEMLKSEEGRGAKSGV